MISKKDYHNVKIETDNIFVSDKLVKYLDDNDILYTKLTESTVSVFTLYLNDKDLKIVEEKVIELQKQYYKPMRSLYTKIHILQQFFDDVSIVNGLYCLRCKLYMDENHTVCPIIDMYIQKNEYNRITYKNILNKLKVYIDMINSDENKWLKFIKHQISLIEFSNTVNIEEIADKLKTRIVNCYEDIKYRNL